MNERQAREKGYAFTGHYSRDKEEMKLRAAELRKLGNQAIVVSIPDDKLSRGYHGTGYSVYWIESSENVAVREAADKQSKINRLRTERQNLLIKADELMEELAELGL